jgi:hypothetical protein
MRRALRNEIQKRARSLLHSQQVKPWTEAMAAADESLRCLARAKSTGRRCRARPEPGREHCRLHGGIVKWHGEEIKALLRAKAAAQPRVRGRFVRVEIEAENA